MLTVKENFLRTLGGEEPEYVPLVNLFWSIRPSVLTGDRGPKGGKDIFGVEWVVEGSAIEAAIPKPGDFILDDIRKWRDVIKFPDFSGVDWDALAKKELENRNPDEPLGGRTTAGGFFQSVMNFMGFTEGLIACVEEPEEVKALINYLCDNYLGLSDQFLQAYKPDFMYFADDIASERSPFVSLETFRDIFEPVWRRYIKFFKDRGLLAMHHNCGHVELFLDDIVDMGFNGWEPAQRTNDLVGIKKKYNSKLMISGALDQRKWLPHIDISEEEIRAHVKMVMDELAPGGGYAFAGGGGARETDPITKQRSEWILDEYHKLKYSYYK
jgi:hypothetical protein